MNRLALALAFTAVAACSRRPAHQPAPPAAPTSAPGTSPTARRPTVDPKSSKAAEDLVRAFARLVNAGQLDEAYMLLGAHAQPRAAFDHNFARFSDRHVAVGTAGLQDGAAGSIYVSVPLSVSGTAGGKHISRSATAVLRRVNDVPGSTEAERHWHIERIDWNDAR